MATTSKYIVNEDIKAESVVLIDEDGNNLGTHSLYSALEAAYSKNLDLVLMSGNSKVPVCRIMDYGKWKYAREKQEKERRRNNRVIETKIIQISYRIDDGDFSTKVRQAKSFLADGKRVEVVLRLRGREIVFANVGTAVVKRFCDACSDVGAPNKTPALDNNNIIVVLEPIAN